LRSCIWELLFARILVVLFCRWCRALLPDLEESAILEHFISVVSSRCPCLRGPRFSHSSDIFLAFDHWFEFFVHFFSFFLFAELVTCLCCQYTQQGGDWGLERPRTGGWSLLAVMSDWQRGVDWLLAEYCMCKLSLICVGAGEEWARKVYALWGLQGVERQVGLTRGTRWPAESSVGHMVAKKARRSRRSEPVQGSGSQTEVYTQGLQRFTTKPSSYLVEPQNQDRWLGGWRRDPSASRSFNACGCMEGSQGLHRDDAVCGDGVAVQWRGGLHDLFAPEGFASQLKCYG
jgi:hypothetical protein